MAPLVTDMLKKSLPDEKPKEKAEKHKRVENVALLQLPQVNTEIWGHKKVKVWAKTQDLKYQKIKTVVKRNGGHGRHC